MHFRKALAHLKPKLGLLSGLPMRVHISKHGFPEMGSVWYFVFGSQNMKITQNHSTLHGSRPTMQLYGWVLFHQNWDEIVTFHQKNFIKKPLSSKTTFIGNHFSSGTIFIQIQFRQNPISSKTMVITNPKTLKP